MKRLFRLRPLAAPGRAPGGWHRRPPVPNRPRLPPARSVGGSAPPRSLPPSRRQASSSLTPSPLARSPGTLCPSDPQAEALQPLPVSLEASPASLPSRGHQFKEQGEQAADSFDKDPTEEAAEEQQPAKRAKRAKRRTRQQLPQAPPEDPAVSLAAFAAVLEELLDPLGQAAAQAKAGANAGDLPVSLGDLRRLNDLAVRAKRARCLREADMAKVQSAVSSLGDLMSVGRGRTVAEGAGVESEGFAELQLALEAASVALNIMTAPVRV